LYHYHRYIYKNFSRPQARWNHPQPSYPRQHSAGVYRVKMLTNIVFDIKKTNSAGNVDIKGAHAWDIRLQSFYTKTNCMGWWLRNKAKKFIILIAKQFEVYCRRQCFKKMLYQWKLNCSWKFVTLFGNIAENLLLPSPKLLKNVKCCRRQCLKFFTPVTNRNKKKF
jgi:hypothetical protein